MVAFVVLLSVLTIGIKGATTEGNILWYVAICPYEWLKEFFFPQASKNEMVLLIRDVLSFFEKPLFRCLECMCSFWGFMMILAFGPLIGTVSFIGAVPLLFSVKAWFLIAMASGVNYFIVQLLTYFEQSQI